MLQAAGLVVSERRGRERRLRLSPAPMVEAMSWIAAVGSQWDERLESLRLLFESHDYDEALSGLWVEMYENPDLAGSPVDERVWTQFDNQWGSGSPAGIQNSDAWSL